MKPPQYQGHLEEGIGGPVEVRALHLPGGPDELPVQAVGPGVVRARELARQPALLLGAEDRAAMPARVVEGAQLAVEIPHDDDALGADLDDLVVPRRRGPPPRARPSPTCRTRRLRAPARSAGGRSSSARGCSARAGRRHPPRVIRGCLRPLHTSSLSVLRELPRPSRGAGAGVATLRIVRARRLFTPLAARPLARQPRRGRPRRLVPTPPGGVWSARPRIGGPRASPRREDGWPCRGACPKGWEISPARPSCIARRSCGTTIGGFVSARRRR